VATTTAGVRQRPHERHDRWWVEPLTIVLVLGLFGVYAFVVSIQNANYYYDPYLSPFYSPCLTTGCVHPPFPIIGNVTVAAIAISAEGIASAIVSAGHLR